MKQTVRVFLFIISFLIVFESCITAEKAFNHGNYELSIDLASKKLMNRPGDGKHLQILSNAFRLANERDMGYIRQWELSTEPTAWENIHRTYQSMSRRQDLVKRATASSAALSGVSLFDFKDYSALIAESKDRAVADLYKAAEELLNSGDRMNARLAYDKLTRVKSLRSQYLGTDRLMSLAAESGKTRVLVSIRAADGIGMPVDLEEELTHISTGDLNQGWIEFSQVQAMNQAVHYYLEVVYTNFNAGSNNTTKSNYTDKTQIQTGTKKTKLDDGTIVITPVMQEVKATVNVWRQQKNAGIQGKVVLSQADGAAEVGSRTVFGQSTFEHTYGKATGDARALSYTSKMLINRKPMAFPSDISMLNQAAAVFKQRMYEQIRNLRGQMR
ncbi:MAG: hypothetical protein FJZ75_10060 [Bacteroidetes bacterium]|nr:hypothetical protein [Bacteroidota bacterium]